MCLHFTARRWSHQHCIQAPAELQARVLIYSASVLSQGSLPSWKKKKNKTDHHKQNDFLKHFSPQWKNHSFWKGFPRDLAHCFWDFKSLITKAHRTEGKWHHICLSEGCSKHMTGSQGLLSACRCGWEREIYKENITFSDLLCLFVSI